jgi:hypothetical protein
VVSETNEAAFREHVTDQPLLEDWRESAVVASLAWILGCAGFVFPFVLYWGTQDRKESLVHRHARAALRIWMIVFVIAVLMFAAGTEEGTNRFDSWAIAGTVFYFGFAVIATVLGIRGLARGWVPFSRNRRKDEATGIARKPSTAELSPSARLQLTLPWWGGLVAGPVPALVIYATSRVAPASAVARSSSAAVKMWAGMLLIWVPVFVFDQALRGGEPGAVALGVFGGLVACLVLSAVGGSIWALRLARDGGGLHVGPTGPPSSTT